MRFQSTYDEAHGLRGKQKELQTSDRVATASKLCWRPYALALTGTALFTSWVLRLLTGEKNSPASAGEIRDTALIVGSGRSRGGRHGNPLQYSWLENDMERVAWWTTIHEVTKSQTWLKRHSTAHKCVRTNW